MSSCGEIDQAVKSNLNYLSMIQKVARTAAKRKDPCRCWRQRRLPLRESRVLGGLVTQPTSATYSCIAGKRSAHKRSDQPEFIEDPFKKIDTASL